MAQIKVGRQQTKPKAINVFRGGQWLMKKIGYVFRSGVWKPFMQHILEIYNEGAEGVPLVEGYNVGISALTKNANNIELKAVARGFENGEVSVVTDSMIDLTGYETVYLEASKQSLAHLRLIVSKDKMGSFSVFDAQTGVASGVVIEKGIFKIDVSDLTGDFYIRVHNRVNRGVEGDWTVIIHKLRLE